MDTRQMYIEGSKKLGIQISENQIEKFIKYKDILLEWNENINLTAITEENEIVIKHFLDSISILKYINLKNKNIIDVGTGAGFPGIPIKIIDDTINVTLLDSLNKRINFLNEVIDKLALKNIASVHGRAEDLGINKIYREKFDICLSRAVANLATLSEYCCPFVKTGGYFISMKGPDVKEELDEAKKAIFVLGCQIEKVEEINLPFTDIKHTIIFIKKIKQCPSNYPRKAGKPNKEPIK